jgi:hypothetical protein
MSTLRQTIETQAAQFAEAIVHALRTASLDELMTISGGSLRNGAVVKPAKFRGGRLGRRSVSDINQTLTQIVGVLAQHPEGLRAEQIRAALQLDTREVPRPIAEGLKSGALKKEGNKRATTYFVASGAAGTARTNKRTKRPAQKK